MLKKKIYPSDVINGKIDHIDVNGYSIIYCFDCPKLKELPLWPNVKTVHCYNCPNLTKLPLWPNVDTVYCHNCQKLTKLPLGPL
jgi:hypothetical protein